MASTFYNYASARSAKARLGVRLNTPFRMALLLAAALLVAGGIVLVFSHVAFGWFVASLAALPVMIHAWHRGDLEHPPVATDSVDGLLDGDILGRLGKNPTPKEIAAAAAFIVSNDYFSGRSIDLDGGFRI